MGSYEKVTQKVSLELLLPSAPLSDAVKGEVGSLLIPGLPFYAMTDEAVSASWVQARMTAKGFARFATTPITYPSPHGVPSKYAECLK